MILNPAETEGGSTREWVETWSKIKARLPGGLAFFMGAIIPRCERRTPPSTRWNQTIADGEWRAGEKQVDIMRLLQMAVE